MSDEYVAVMIGAAAKLRNAQFMKLAGLCFLCYDYLLTLGDEIQFVWPSSWSILKVAFMAGRYTPFISMLATVYTYLGHSYPGDAICIGLSYVHIWFMMIAIVCCQIIQAMRTYALYWNFKKMGWVLVAMLAAEVASIIPLTIRFTNSFSMRPQGPPWDVTASTDYLPCGARLNAEFKVLSPLYLLVLVTEFLIVTLTGWRYFGSDRRHMKYIRFTSDGHDSIIRVLYRDGLMYFLYIFAFALGNVLVLYVDESQYNKWPFQFSGVLQSCLGTRIVIHIRKTVIQNEQEVVLIGLSNFDSSPNSSPPNHAGSVTKSSLGRGVRVDRQIEYS